MGGKANARTATRKHLLEPLLTEERQLASRVVALGSALDPEELRKLAESHLRHQRSAIRLVADYESLRDAALGAMPADDRLAALLQGTRSMLDTKVAAVLMLDEGGTDLWPRVSSGFRTALGLSPVPVNGVIRKVLESGVPLIIDEANPKDAFHRDLLAEGIQSVMVVPLRFGKEVRGVLMCGHPGTKQFTQRDVQLLELVGDRMAMGLERGRLLEAMSRSRQEAEAVSQFKTTLLHMATHDLKTPLTAIRMQLHLLSEFEVTEDQRKKSAGLIGRNVDRLAALLDDFLDLARAEAGRLSIRPVEFDLTLLLQECQETFGEQARQKGLTLRVEASRQVKAIGDARRISQVLANLVSNAIRYSDTGTIRIAVKRSRKEVAVEVQDEGIGLTRDQAAHLFQPFTQVHPSRESGTGLGLYLSKAIATAHGGRLTLASDGPGTGTTATLTLPRIPG